MDILTKELCIDSTEKTDFIDVTEDIKGFVRDSGISDGIINIYTTHTTTAIRINENEEGLINDAKSWLEKNAPGLGQYRHDDMEKRKGIPVDEPVNGHSHLKSLIMGASETIPVIGCSLKLGTWQRIFFVDLDGPRKRRMIMHILGKKDGHQQDNKRA